MKTFGVIDQEVFSSGHCAWVFGWVTFLGDNCPGYYCPGVPSISPIVCKMRVTIPVSYSTKKLNHATSHDRGSFPLSVQLFFLSSYPSPPFALSHHWYKRNSHSHSHSLRVRGLVSNVAIEGQRSCRRIGGLDMSCVHAQWVGGVI